MGQAQIKNANEKALCNFQFVGNSCLPYLSLLRDILSWIVHDLDLDL